MQIKPIETNLTGTIELTVMDVTAKCPFTNGNDTYEVMISIEPVGGRVPEYESLSEWLESFSDTEITQEDLTSRIIDTVTKAIEPSSITVEVTGVHGRVEATTIESQE